MTSDENLRRGVVSSIPGLREFLRDYPLMAPRPRPGQTPLLTGRFAFIARHPGTDEIDDAFDLEIDVPAAFPAISQGH